MTEDMCINFVVHSLCEDILFVMLKCIGQRCNVYIFPIEFHRYLFLMWYIQGQSSKQQRKQAKISSNFVKIILLEYKTNQVTALIKVFTQ